MVRFALVTLLGLCGAGIVHIVVLLMLPQMSERGAWFRLAESAGLNVPIPIDGRPGGLMLRPHDPAFLATACRFDIAQAPLRVESEGAVPFWSATVHDRNGSSLYSVDDRSGKDGRLDLAILSTDQMIEIRRERPAYLEGSILTETSAPEGIVVVRALVPDPSWADTVGTFMDRLVCSSE